MPPRLIPWQAQVNIGDQTSNALQNLMAIKMMGTKNALLEQEMAEKEAMRQVFAEQPGQEQQGATGAPVGNAFLSPGGEGGGMSGINPQAVEKLMRINPMAGMKLMGVVREQQAEARKLQQEQMKVGFEYLDKFGPLLEINPQAYGQVHRTIAGSNPAIAAMMPPPDASPEQVVDFVNRAKQAKMSYEKQVELGKPTIEHYQSGDEMVYRERYFDPKTNSYQYREIGRGPKYQEESIEATPEGGVRIIKGGKGGSNIIGLGKKASDEIETGFLKSTEETMSTQRIAKSFKPEYATIGGQWEGFKLRWKDKLGGGLSPEENATLSGFAGYRMEAGRHFAQSLKNMSGTAVTEPEMKRQEIWLINPGTGIFDGDSPTVVQEKLKRLTDFQAMATARLNYARKYGLSVKNVEELAKTLPLAQMPQAMKKVESDIVKDFEKQGMKGDQLKSAVRSELSKMMGLVE